MSAPTIYLVTNTVNGHTYVGVTRFPLEKRWSEHVTKSRMAHHTYLHRAIAKYGPQAFTVEPIASCLDTLQASAVERAVIQRIQPTYNQTNGGEFTVGRRVSPDVAERIRRGNVGKTRTPEQRAANAALKRKQLLERPEYRARMI